MYGQGDVKSKSMNAHKNMAGAGMSGSFGVDKMPGRTMMHPDLKMTHAPMADSERMPPAGRMQGSPDHGVGKGHPDHFLRAGKA